MLTTKARDHLAAGIASRKAGTELANLLDSKAIARLDKAADGAAGNATAETVIGSVPAGITEVTQVRYTPNAALTADASNNATLIVGKRTAGGSRTTVATMTTNVAGGSWTAWVPKKFTVTAFALAADDVLTLEITKAGTGVVVPAGVLQVF